MPRMRENKVPSGGFLTYRDMYPQTEADTTESADLPFEEDANDFTYPAFEADSTKE